ncbi:MAG TPA: acetylglutamate kinase [Balneolaceae bacterium]|nr:acetylglutamate kinase [Balneolaceae bacterium]
MKKDHNNFTNFLEVIKIGGSIANNPSALDDFLKNFVQLDHSKILVHGGGNAATNLCKRLNIPIKMNQGRRITDEPALDVAVMVYAGLINKKIVAKMQALSCNALGLSGADLNSIPAKKRNHPEIDYGFVGDIEPDDINTHHIRRLIEDQIVPVFSAITHDTKGQLFNTNADTIAASLAMALAGNFDVTLTYCFEKKGVLEDVNDETSWISELSRQQFIDLKNDGSIHEGMIPKLETGFEALHQDVKQVRIKNAENLVNDIGTKLSL